MAEEIKAGPGPEGPKGHIRAIWAITIIVVLAILVGGGPAPGINSVIGAATIRAIVEGVEVLGIKDGFKWIMEGNISEVKESELGRKTNQEVIMNMEKFHFD